MSEEVKEATEVAVEEAKTEEVVEAPVSTEQTENSIALDGKMAEFVDWIETISVLELSQLVKALEDRLGVAKEEADSIKEKLEGAGATVELK